MLLIAGTLGMADELAAALCFLSEAADRERAKARLETQQAHFRTTVDG